VSARGIAAAGADVKVCFAPPLPDGCDPVSSIVQTLNSAQHQILVQAYQFTSVPIAKAIIDAHGRGVDVRVILDKSNQKEGYSASTFLQHEGVPVMIDSAHNIAHNKVMIIDRQTVITGSFNFTKNAEERNAENLVVIKDPVVAATYVRNWNDHLAHSHLVEASKNVRDSHPADAELAKNEIVGNQRSHIFAWPGCGSFDTMAPANRVAFANRQAAETAGFRVAKNCP
jgi:phosphatidylserine/phosphatidylglycerophosphate/cardiolipin synthase-like enzyme